MIVRTHKIRLNPTPEQENYFYRAAGVARFVWNWALEEYRNTKALGAQAEWNDLKKYFNEIKYERFPFVAEVTKCAAEQALADLHQAINTYYKTKQAHPKSKVRFPGRRQRRHKIGGFGLANDKFSVEGHTVRIPKLGPVNMAEPLRFGASARILSGRVKYSSGHWYLVVTVELSLQVVGASAGHGSLGIDFGLSRFATFSHGEGRETQAYFRRAERKLRILERSLSRKRKGSRRRAKAMNAAINILLEGLRLLAGSGYVGASGVEFATSARSFGFAQAAD
jgi:putative transposase